MMQNILYWNKKHLHEIIQTFNSSSSTNTDSWMYHGFAILILAGRTLIYAKKYMFFSWSFMHRLWFGNSTVQFCDVIVDHCDKNHYDSCLHAEFVAKYATSYYCSYAEILEYHFGSWLLPDKLWYHLLDPTNCSILKVHNIHPSQKQSNPWHTGLKILLFCSDYDFVMLVSL